MNNDPIPGWNPNASAPPPGYGPPQYYGPPKKSKAGLYALSVGLFLLAFPCLVFPPLGVLVWMLSVITLIVAIAR